MKNRILSGVFFAIGFLIALPTQVTAAPLGLTTEDPVLSASVASIDYLVFGTDGDLSTFGATIDSASGVSPVGLTEFGFGFGFALSDPTTGSTGGFDITDQNGLFLAGDLMAVGFSEDVIELQFNNLSGSAAGDFGSSVLAQFAFNQALGTDPFASLVDGASYDASVTVSKVANTSAVPESPVLALLALGLAGLGWRRREHSRA